MDNNRDLILDNLIATLWNVDINLQILDVNQKLLQANEDKNYLLTHILAELKKPKGDNNNA